MASSVPWRAGTQGKAMMRRGPAPRVMVNFKPHPYMQHILGLNEAGILRSAILEPGELLDPKTWTRVVLEDGLILFIRKD